MAINLPGGFNILNSDPVDARISVADATARLGFSVVNVYEGLTVYQQDTNEVYVLINAASPSSTASWSLIYPATSTSSPWLITGSTLYTSQSFNVQATGSFTVIGTIPDVFIIKSNSDSQNLLKVSSSGVVQMYVHNADPTAPAELGQIYFTSSSLFLGLQ
jgi:hypothetical protein